MIKQITNVLDENKIKYYTEETENSAIIFIDFQKSRQEDMLSLSIFFSNEPQAPFIVFAVPEVCIIPSKIREKVKNYILDYNASTLLGAFAVRKLQKTIDYHFAILLTYTNNGQAVEIKKIPEYIIMITELVLRVRTTIQRMNSKRSNAYDETASTVELKNV